MEKEKKGFKKIYSVIEDYLIITIGLLCYTTGWSIFILPNDLVGGGVSGIGAIIQYATHGRIPVAYSFFFINLILLMIGLKVLGKGFGVKTVYALVMTSVFFRILPEVIPHDLINNLTSEAGNLLSAIIGGAMSGLGIGLTFTRGGSTAGTDIIALIINKYRNISPGKMILLMDIVIVGSSIFLPLEGGDTIGTRIADIMCGYLLVGSCSVVIDLYVSGSKQSVQLFIFSKQYEAIADMISKTMHRGVTIIDGKGWYSKQDEKILLVMIRKTESHTLLSFIKQIDKSAFISVGNVMGVYGLGFEAIKEKKKNKKV